VNGSTALPIAKTSTGFLDERLESGHVPGVNAMFNHQLARSLGHQHEAVKITQAACALGAADHFEKRLLMTGFDEPRQARIEDERLR
jgi:hypothetical protein